MDKIKLNRKPIVFTQDIKDVGRKIISAVRNDDFLAIVGRSGAGKNTALRISLDQIKQRKTKYIVVQYTVMTISSSDITGLLMTAQVKALLPGEKVARDIVARYSQLERGLIQAKQSGKNTILVIDEAQNLNQSTLYGLKKLHEIGQSFEIEYLFSIILVGQSPLENLIRPAELCFRIHKHNMQGLSAHEVKELLRAYGYDLSCMKVLQKITRATFETPMGVVHYIRLLKNKFKLEHGSTIQLQHIYSLLGLNLLEEARRANLTNQAIADGVKEMSGKRVASSTISSILSCKLDTEFAKEIRDMIPNIIEKKLQMTGGLK